MCELVIENYKKEADDTKRHDQIKLRLNAKRNIRFWFESSVMMR